MTDKIRILTGSNIQQDLSNKTVDSGYSSFAYTQALSHMGQPLRLPASGGWLLQQRIGATGYEEARGAYPLFCCENWQKLSVDFSALDESIVAVSLVTDPFRQPDEAMLREIFPDRVFRFKSHFIVNFSQPPASFVSKHHLRNARKAAKSLKIFEAQNPGTYLASWYKLYANLVKRHNICGLAAFSNDSFAKQFTIPGLRVFVAKQRDIVVGMLLCVMQGDHGYYHLTAFSDRGYELGASFGLFLHSIEVLADDGIRKMDLGGVAGLLNSRSKESGLARFKQGWANDVCDVWFCGHVLNRDAYEGLCHQYDGSSHAFFPAYRAASVGAIHRSETESNNDLRGALPLREYAD